MRIVPIAGRSGRTVALALAVALAAGCDAEPGAADATDAAGTTAPGTATPPATLPPPVAGPDAGPGTDATPDPLPVPSPVPGDDDDDATGPGANGATTVPHRFQGRYAADQAACSAPGNPTRLTIGDDAITFHESSGPITAVDSGPADLTITAELTGEGETREATYVFRLSEDGGTLTDQEGGMERVRCN